MENSISVAEDFLSRISKERFWKCVEVKACLLKNSADKIWKVAFMQLQLINESQIYEKKLPHTKNLILIHKIIGIESLGVLVKQISEGKRVSIGNQIASLEWIKEKPRYDFKMRAYVKQSFHIDEACHMILKSGDYTDKIDSIVRNLEPLDWKEHESYRDLKDALEQLLNVEWGKPAYPPFVRIFAPIYVKIHDYKIHNQRLIVTLSSALEAKLSKINLRIFGEHDNGRRIEPSQSIRIFKRRYQSRL